MADEITITNGKLKPVGDDLFLNEAGALFKVLRFPDGCAELRQISKPYGTAGE